MTGSESPMTGNEIQIDEPVVDDSNQTKKDIRLI